MATTDRWWTYPAAADNGKTILVTGRDGMEKIIANGKYIYRVDVSWDYETGESGMPSDEDAGLMEQATDALQHVFGKDKIAYMTAIYTGDGRREWIFYTKNLKIFSTVFNRALADLPLLPLKIDVEEDAGWEEYLNMRELTYIPKDSEE